MSHIERVKEVRAIVEPHYNCGQSILVPFCKELGMTEEQAYALGAHLGKGMRHGGTSRAPDRAPQVPPWRIPFPRWAPRA